MFKKKLALLGLSLALGAGAVATGAQAVTKTQVQNGIAKAIVAASTKTLDTACVSTAVDTRDTAIINAEMTLHTAWSTALTTRLAALKAGWALTDQTARRAAIKAAWKTYKASYTTAWKAFRTSRNAAWKTWDTSRKTCGANAADDKTDKSVDAVNEPLK